MTRVAVTGIGMVTPLASNANDTWNKLIEGQSGIRKITSFETSDLSVKIAGQIPKGEKEDCFNPDLFVEKKDQRKIDDFILYAIAAADQAISDSGIGTLKEEDAKKAGVLILLLKEDHEDEYKILFTKRSSKLKTHSGEVSFPGGKWEEEDKNLYETALRESNEEINLEINNVTQLGRLDILLSRHKIEVNPYVGYLDKFQHFKGNFEIVKLLVDNKARLDIQNNTGATALILSLIHI